MMKTNSGWVFLFIFLFSGCASAPPTPLLSGTTREATALCFSSNSEIASIVEKFFASRDLTTEEGKIDYLLNRVRDSRVVFIRNREKYTSQDAAEFLRWKLDRLRGIHKMKINTAQEFVNQVSSGSRMSGEPYIVTFRDGSRYPLKDILQNELNQLELCLKTDSQEAAPAAELPQSQPNSADNQG